MPAEKYHQKYSRKMVDRPNEQWSNLTDEQKQKRRESIARWRYKNPVRAVYRNVKHRAKERGIHFDLQESDIVVPEFCPVLGIKLKTGPGKLSENSPSVDRIVPTLGYVKGNIIVISHKANMIKSNATPEEILKVGLFFEALLKEREKAA